MKKIFAIILFLFVLTAQAQIGFEKGYYINNNGVKTDCYIKNIDWRNNPVSFSYKTNSEDSKVLTESIATVSEFGIDNFSRYKRYTVNIEYSSNDIKTLSKFKNPVWSVETLFLEELVNGEAHLYSYSKDNTTKYFYETKTTAVEQLVRIKYSTDDYVQENNLFRQQLYNNVRCQNTPDGDFKNIGYDKNELVKHFLKYNSCTDSPVTDLTKIAKRESYSVKVFAGLYTANLSINDPDIFYNVDTEISKTIFKIGFEGEYILPFYKNKISIFASPSYQKFSASKNYDKSDGNVNSTTIHHTATVDYSSIEIPLGVRYYFFLNKTSKIYLNAALVLDLPMSSSLKFENTNNAFNATHAFEISTSSCFAAGIGYSYKRFSAELRMFTEKQILNEERSWSAKYKTTGLNIAYKLF